MDTHETEQTKRKNDRDENRSAASTATSTTPTVERRPTASTTKPPAPKKKTRVSDNNVRKLRTERMMSKAELARRAGLSTLTIDRVEKGMPCRMDTKRKILEALGLTPTDRVAVFGEDD